MASESAAAGSTPVASRGRVWGYALLPLVLLGLFVLFFLRVGPLGVLRAAFPPVEDLTITRVALRPGLMEVFLTNGGPAAVTVAQVLVDDAYWHFTIHPGPTLPRLGRATITIPYPWVQGEAHTITVLTGSGLTFAHIVEVATESPRPTRAFLLSFTLLGAYVGVVPVFVGVLWFPFLRRLSRRWVHFFLSLTAGLLVFLGVDALEGALSSAGAVPGALRGTALVAMGLLGSILALLVVGRLAGGRAASSRLVVSYLIAAGIGLHNLGEGLAIGAAYNLGQIALVTLLVTGFMLHNTTEGLGIVAPVAREGAALRHLLALGMVAGAPTIGGTWIGGFTYSPILATLFLAVGAGAIFQVVVEVGRLVASEAAREVATLLNTAGFVLGLAIMYFTGLFVAL
ncbi:MAG: metal transporter [Armatimonadota bacterium]|nr:metal transporter [Armatimonadota bacterium]MDR7427494.1 metal transporter [Armatimonadota bacterium]MDR7469827.1 metal transporter [Armatimonadota bacterium]MDR7475212.1 metal transporter [Armatimonadota bacterium]MDR7540325.1 metal transporter [Armatimonadota bacterium]